MNPDVVAYWGEEFAWLHDGPRDRREALIRDIGVALSDYLNDDVDGYLYKELLPAAQRIADEWLAET